MNKTFAFFLLFLTLGSCEDSIKFEQPQPLNQNNLKRIPLKLRGTYFSTSDSSYLTINKHAIIDWIDLEIMTLKDSLDIEVDSTKIVEQSTDFVEMIDGKCKVDLRFLEDSVLVHFSYRDTLFEISDRHILRRFKGHYFLNYKRSETNWKVRRLTLDKTELSFSKIRVPEDIDRLKQITEIKEIKSDSGKVTGYKLNPSRKELKQLMRHNFSETIMYKKIK